MEKQYYKFDDLKMGSYTFSPENSIEGLRSSYDLSISELTNELVLQFDGNKIMMFQYDPSKINKSDIERILTLYAYNPLNYGKWQDIVNEYNSLLSGALDINGDPVPLFDSTLTRLELIVGRVAQYNEYTDYLITYSFKYNDTHSITLKSHDQRNFSELNNMAEEGVVTYPRPVKKSDDSVTYLTNFDELKSLINQIRLHIDTLLGDGWLEKAAIINMTVEQLQAWVDPRK